MGYWIVKYSQYFYSGGVCSEIREDQNDQKNEKKWFF